jgi:hypothetical protein
VNVSGASQRHIAQSMHESSTKYDPGALPARRAERRAMRIS